MALIFSFCCFVLLLMPMIGCGDQDKPLTQEPEVAEAQTTGVNWVQELGLQEAVELRIEDREQGEGVITISDRAALANLLLSVEGSFAIEPRLRCMAAYKLTFVKSEEQSEEMFVVCLGEPQAINGNQKIWNDGQVRLPQSFLDQLAQLAAQ